MNPTRQHRSRGPITLVLPALALLAACSDSPEAATTPAPPADAPAEARPAALVEEGAGQAATPEPQAAPQTQPTGSSSSAARTAPPPARVPRAGDGEPQAIASVPPGSTVPGATSSGSARQLDTSLPATANAPSYAGEKDPDAKLAIEFGDEKHDFGSARQGDLLEHTFELESSGTNPVLIRQASPTCGCTVSDVMVEGADGEFEKYKYGSPIEPGKRVQLSAKLDTTHKRNKTQVRINVYTNDPIGLTQLALSADIEPFIKAVPAFVNLGDIKEGETKSQVIDIRTSRGERVMLEMDAQNPIKVPPGMDVALEAVSPDEQGKSDHWRATLSVGPGANEGPIGYQLRLVSDMEMPDAQEKIEHGERSLYTVNASVNGRVLGVLSFTPQFLSMGLVRPGQRVARNVKLISHDPEFDLSGVEVSLAGENGQELAWAEHFTTKVKPAAGLANAVDIELQLEGLPDGADGSFRGVMVIQTGHEKKPEVSVRFSGVCRAGVTSVR